MESMKRKWLIVGAVIVGILLLLILGGPLMVKLGMKPVCIQGSWPDIKVVVCGEPAAAAPTVTPLPMPTLSGQAPIPIIVDDDGSPDGVIALLYFLSHPAFDVRAVTVSCGEAHPQVFAPQMLQLLAGLGRGDIPVGAGRETPLEGSNVFPDPWRQASDAFWDIELPQATVSSEPVPAAELMVETLTNSPQAVRVFVSGGHTNLAEALRLEPGIAEKIEGVYIMGGSLYAPGNIKSDWPEIDNSVAEWNIWVDPVAAKEVFASGIPLHVNPLDSTVQVAWTRPDVATWTASGSPEGRMAAKLLQWMLDSWSPEGVYIWDLVAAVNTSDAALCPEVALAVDVTIEPGPEQGRTVVTNGAPNAAACLDPDAGQIKARAAYIFGR
jgi:inosine-uridine nucleoside N-ribohydrolase